MFSRFFKINFSIFSLFFFRTFGWSEIEPIDLIGYFYENLLILEYDHSILRSFVFHVTKIFCGCFIPIKNSKIYGLVTFKNFFLWQVMEITFLVLFCLVLMLTYLSIKLHRTCTSSQNSLVTNPLREKCSIDLVCNDKRHCSTAHKKNLSSS